MKLRASFALTLAVSLSAQTPAPKALLGTISAFHASSAEIEVKQDSGAVSTVKITETTVAKKIGPGQTDLTKAEDINVTDLLTGDRVLVTLGAPDPMEARRIVVISANDIGKRDAADRADWQKRGVSGVVTGVAGNDVTVELRSLGGATKYTVTIAPKTSFKRYASDSVRFSDAKKSSLAEVAAGDQLRARGQKNADGTRLDAEEVVFGTFLSKAGTIVSINAEAREITIKDLANNKPLVVKILPESKVKRMAEAAGAGRGAAGARPPDIAQMLDALPPVRIEDLKNGEIVVVSAIRGAKPDQVTAITFLANAEVLVQLAMAARGAGANGPAPSLAGLASSISSVGP